MARSPGTKATSAAKPTAKPRASRTGAGTASAGTAGTTTSGTGDVGSVGTDARAAILDAFMALLAQKPFERISLGEVAAKAGITLSALRASFGSTFDMLSSFIRETDRKVLAGTGDDMDDQPARDRLFDVLMRRLDVLSPYRPAIRSLAQSARRSPFFALALNRLSVRSQQWMLAAAKIDTAGLRGAVRAQGLAVLFARVTQTFLRDEDPSLAKTMSALDRELAKGERALGLLESTVQLATCRRRGRTPEETAEDAAPDAPAVA